MRKVTVKILLILIFAVSVTAQSKEQKPELIDDFGVLNLEEIMARLDYFISSVKKISDTKGLVRIYGGDADCLTCHYRRGSLVIAYLENTRKFSSDSYSIEYCNDSKELRMQLYLMPPLTKLPKCKENLETPQQSVVFDRTFFDSNDSKLKPLEDVYISVEDSADGEYSRNAWKAVKNALNKSPESKIYVMVYLGTTLETEFEEKNGQRLESTRRIVDKESLANKMLMNAKKELLKNGTKSSQIETIKGGYVDGKRKLEFWFVPKGGEIPKPKPTYFPKKKRQKKK